MGQTVDYAFEAAQRSIVAALPGAVYRYINSGLNVLGAIIRDQIERRGLPYHETSYGLLIDRLGMASYHSADIAGNLIASGAGFATLRDYAKLGVLYLQNGVWNGERLLPPGWADYALTATHTGTSYAACFRTNIHRQFPDLPLDTAWASGASDQRIFILRRHRLTTSSGDQTRREIGPNEGSGATGLLDVRMSFLVRGPPLQGPKAELYQPDAIAASFTAAAFGSLRSQLSGIANNSRNPRADRSTGLPPLTSGSSFPASDLCRVEGVSSRTGSGAPLRRDRRRHARKPRWPPVGATPRS